MAPLTSTPKREALKYILRAPFGEGLGRFAKSYFVNIDIINSSMSRHKHHLPLLIEVISFVISVCLIVVGFLLPPAGVIDGSVITAVGELLAFGVLAKAIDTIEDGRSAHINTGHTSISIGAKDPDHDSNNPNDNNINNERI